MIIKLKSRIILLMLSFLMIIILLFTANNLFNNKKIERIKEVTKVNRNQFAMYIENSDDGTYEEYKGSGLFPSPVKYSFNMNESYCIDIKENIVSNALSYANGKITVTSNKTVYCYLYFDFNVFDIETDILVKDGDGYKSVSETPTTDTNYNYTVRYDCTNNEGIVSFYYDYKNHKYRLISSTKNKCDIYFEEMIPDIKINIYIDEEKVSEIPTTRSYTLNKTLSTCTNSEATISYNNTTKKVRVKSNKTTICSIYLEGA